MPNRITKAAVAVNANVQKTKDVDIDKSILGNGAIVAALSPYITATEYGSGVTHQTHLTFTALPQTIVNGTEYQGTKIYDFPEGRILILGATMSMAQTTTSDLATTLNASSTGAIGFGMATASSTTLSTTMQDVIPTTAFTSSATINVAGTAVGAALSTSAQFDGHTTAKDLYLNTAFATTADIDGDATQTLSGTLTVTWINLGDY